jgi:DNA polymerase-3 subunit gamma/tau
VAPAPVPAKIDVSPPAVPAALAAAAVQVKAAAPAAATPDFGSSVPPWEDLPPEADEIAPVRSAPRPAPASVELPAPVSAEANLPEPAVPAPARAAVEPLSAALDWHALLGELGLGGFNRELAQHSELVGVADNVLSLRLSHTHRHLLQINRGGPEKLQEALSAHFGRALRVNVEVGEIETLTPAQRNQAEKAGRHAAAVAALEQDPFVRELIERFDATLEEASVKFL